MRKVEVRSKVEAYADPRREEDGKGPHPDSKVPALAEGTEPVDAEKSV